MQVGINADDEQLLVSSRSNPVPGADWVFTRRHGPWHNHVSGVYRCDMPNSIMHGVTMVVRPIRTGGFLMNEGIGARGMQIQRVVRGGSAACLSSPAGWLARML